mgnify:CR=1 FL=1
MDCHEEHEETSSIFLAALRHTLEIFVFILLFSFIIGLVFEAFGEEPIAAALSGMGVFQPMLTALVGLVPNCAVSVLLAQLYVQGAITFGSLFAGLTAGAGVGLAVLWRVNPSWKQNLFMTGLLWRSVRRQACCCRYCRCKKIGFPRGGSCRPQAADEGRASVITCFRTIAEGRLIRFTSFSTFPLGGRLLLRRRNPHAIQY